MKPPRPGEEEWLLSPVDLCKGPGVSDRELGCMTRGVTDRLVELPSSVPEKGRGERLEVMGLLLLFPPFSALTVLVTLGVTERLMASSACVTGESISLFLRYFLGVTERLPGELTGGMI